MQRASPTPQTFTLPALVALLALGAGCAPEDTLLPFDVTLITLSDCSQVGQGGVNCEDEEDLQGVTLQGRWIFDYRGADTFAVTTESGKTIAGVYFANDGRVETTACQGTGGVCHFARTRFAATDEATGCTKLTERVIDVVASDEGLLFGQMTDVSVVEECETSLITQVIIDVSGAELDEAVRSREGAQP